MTDGNWTWLEDQIRARFGTSRTRLAHILGVSRQRLSYWVSGRNDPDFLRALLLAYFFAADSAEELARKAGIDWDSLIAGINARAEAAGLELPAPGGDKFTTTLYQLFEIQDVDALGIVVEYYKYNSSFQNLRDLARRLLKDSAHDELMQARLWFYVGYAELMQGRAAEAIRSASRARALIPPEADKRLLADTYWLSGESARVIGRNSAAYTDLLKADRIYKTLGVKPTTYETGPMWVEWDLCRLESSRGSYRAALERLDRMSSMARTSGLAEASIIALWTRARLEEELSNFDIALAEFQKASEFANLIGDRFWEAQSLRGEAEIKRKLGRYREAIQTAATARDLYSALENEKLARHSELVIAASYLQMGKHRVALDLYSQARQTYLQAKDQPMVRLASVGEALAQTAIESGRSTPYYEPSLWTLQALDASRPALYEVYPAAYERLALAETLRLAGQLERALEKFQKTLQASVQFGHQLEQAHALLGIAETRRQLGRPDTGHCHQALEIYKKSGAEWGTVHALISLALTARDLGRTPLALLTDALRIAQKRSMRADEQYIRALLDGGDPASPPHLLLFL